MKYLLIACLALMLCGCPKPQNKGKVQLVEPTEEGMVIKKLNHYGEYEIKEFEYDGCQYIVIGAYDRMTITHKGNCKYCLQRNK
jgi:hypothetical protein